MLDKVTPRGYNINRLVSYNLFGEQAMKYKERKLSKDLSRPKNIKGLYLITKTGQQIRVFTDGINIWAEIDDYKTMCTPWQKYLETLPHGRMLENGKAIFKGIAKDMLLNQLGVNATVDKVFINIQTEKGEEK